MNSNEKIKKEREVEFEKIKKEEERELELEYKKIELEKMKIEIQELKKSYLNRFVFPEVPKWIPAILIAAVSLFITFKTNLFKTEADKAKIEQEKLTMQKQKSLIQDTITNLLKDKNTLNSAILNLQKDTLIMRQRVDSTQEKIDSLNIAILFESANKKNILKEINILSKEKDRLLSEIRFAPLSSKLSLLKNNPNPEYDFTEEIITHLSSNGEFKSRLLDSISFFRNDKRLYPITTFILYRTTSSEKYFQALLDNVGQSINKYRTKSDIYNYKVIDSVDFASINSLFSIISSNRWKKERKLSISKIIIDSLYNHYVDNNIYNTLLNIPRVLNLNMDFDLLALDPSLFFKYLRLNMYLVDAEESVSGYEFLGDTIHTTITIGAPGEDLGNTEYFYNRTRRKKIDCLINVSLFCPQIYYSYKIKQLNILINDKLNKKNTTAIQMSLVQDIMQENTLDYYPRLQGAIDSIDEQAFPDDLLENNFSDSLSYFIKSDTGITMPVLMKKMGKEVKQIYDANSFLIEAWLDKDFEYMKRNKKILEIKLKTFSL